jgi:hypothetical protein
MELTNINMSEDYEITNQVLKAIWEELKINIVEEGETQRKNIVFKKMLRYFSIDKKNYKNASLEWDVRTDLTQEYVEDDIIYCQCICTHIIHELHFIENKHNGNILMVGRDCVKKIDNNSLQQTFDKHIRDLDYQKTGKTISRQCNGCHKFKIRNTLNPLINLCKSCFLDITKSVSDNYWSFTEKKRNVINALQEQYLPRKFFKPKLYYDAMLKKSYYMINNEKNYINTVP